MFLNSNKTAPKGDYDTKGIPGIGKETACKFLKEVTDYEKEKCTRVDILDLLRKWNDASYKGIGLSIEDRLRRIVLKTTVTFPNEDIIKEYMTVSQQAKDVLNLDFFHDDRKWSRPHLMKLQVSWF